MIRTDPCGPVFLRALHLEEYALEKSLSRQSSSDAPNFFCIFATEIFNWNTRERLVYDGFMALPLKNSLFSSDSSEGGHLPAKRKFRDFILGMNDGMVTMVSFLGGLTGSSLPRPSILYAALMTAIAGSLSMAIGGYLGSRTQNDIFRREMAREKWEIENIPDTERQEVRNLFLSFGLNPEQSDHVTEKITSDPSVWHRFMVREELGIHEEDIENPLKGGLLLGGSFIIGALPPLLPYFFISKIGSAFTDSLLFSCLALFLTGSIKSRLSNEPPLKGAGEMVILGGIAGVAGLFIGTILPRFLSLIH